MVGDDGDEHREVEIRKNAPGEIEIAFVRERWPDVAGIVSDGLDMSLAIEN